MAKTPADFPDVFHRILTHYSEHGTYLATFPIEGAARQGQMQLGAFLKAVREDSSHPLQSLAADMMIRRFGRTIEVISRQNGPVMKSLEDGLEGKGNIMQSPSFADSIQAAEEDHNPTRK